MSSFFIRRPIFAIVISIIIVILGGLIPPLPADCPVSADFAADSQSEYDVHRR